MSLIKAIIGSIKTNTFSRFLFKNVLYGVLKLLFLTYRLRVTYADGVRLPLSDQEGVFYFWHQHILSGMFFFNKLKSQGACIVSPSGDGKIAGYLCQRLGFTVLYGSSFKSPITLLRSAFAALQGKRRLCMVGDGSRGPAFKLQPGIAYLAEKVDVPVLFIDCHPARAITFTKSWDQFKLPLPFTTISITVSSPQHVRTSSSS
jgi:lysophospholipid acyltransferase (LPLAT)-like uncharacterized protein